MSWKDDRNNLECLYGEIDEDEDLDLCKLRSGRTCSRLCPYHIRQDRRGKHFKSDREAKKRRLDDSLRVLEYNPQCRYCGAIGAFREATCTRCGHIDDSIEDNNPTYLALHDLGRVVIYNPRFYFKERLNNWVCICPKIPFDHLSDIFEVVFKRLGRSFSINCITRELIYSIINELYGRGSEGHLTRRYLVYRERWLYIKREIALLSIDRDYDIFRIPDAGHFLVNLETYRPTFALLDRLEHYFVCLLPLLKEARRNGKRRNRPSIDVIILFLLYGFHPSLVVFYGWWASANETNICRYWRLPKSQHSLDKNEERVQAIFKEAKERFPFYLWPTTTTKIIQSIVGVRSEGLEASPFSALLPNAVFEQERPEVYYRDLCVP